jgi:ATP-binding cassette subfamily C protein
VVLLARDISVQSLQNDFVESLRSQITHALAFAGWERVMRLRHARVLHAMGGDIQRITSTAYFLAQIGIALFILIAQCALALWLAPSLAVMAIGLLLVGGLAILPVMRRARALGAYVTTANLSLIDATTQFLSGLKLAVSQNLQEGFTAEFHDTLVILRERQLGYARELAGGRVALTTLSALVGAAAVLIGYGLLGIGAPILIAFLLVVGRMSGPASVIQQGLQQMSYGLPAYEKAKALLSELKPLPPPPHPAAQIPPGDIVLDGVSYFHATTETDDRQGLDDATLCIADGAFLGVLGPSGSGKTTLADLVVGLVRPQAGVITAGGMSLDENAIVAWRARLSYVSQDAFLFHDSVRRNLLWANPAASEADMWSALALAAADAVVRRMDKGLDTIVGERGALMSGGERQRIALARAVLRKPRLLVLDEATSAIDIATERAILERLRATQPRMTIVLIAHRPESLALCDRRIRVDAGRIAEMAAGAV